MNRRKSFVAALTALVVLPAAAQTQTAGIHAELDALVAQREDARVQQLVRQRLANGDDPSSTYFQVGRVYFDHEAWQRSAEFLEQSLKLKPVNDEARQLLGLVWRALHRPDDAERELLEAAKENPANKMNAYFAGHQLLLNGKFEAALPFLYSALDSKALQSQALQALGLAQARLGNYGLAESYFRKAIDATQATEDGHYSALVNLAILLLLDHDPARLEEGLSCVQRAGKLQPDSPEVHYLVGKALFKLGRFREASPELAQAVKLNPEDSKPHFLLARIYDQLGQHERALEERKRIARIQDRPGQTGMAKADRVTVTSE